MTTYTYTVDGTLVSQATSGVTTRYTQDFAAPLSQVLQTKVGSDTPTDYLWCRLEQPATMRHSRAG